MSEPKKDAYNTPYWWYDMRGLFILITAYQHFLIRQIRFFRGNIGKRHLEAAIGSGGLFELVLFGYKLNNIEEIVGFDYSERMLAGAKKKFRKKHKIRLIQADIADTKLPDGYFDTVNIANSIHAFPDPDAALKEMYRVLKPGGLLAMNALLYPRGGAIARRIASRVNRWGQKKGILHAPFEEADIKNKLTQLGFDIVEDTISGNGLFVVCCKN